MSDMELSDRALLVFGQLQGAAKAMGESDGAALAQAPAFDFLWSMAQLSPAQAKKWAQDPFARQALDAYHQARRSAIRPEGLVAANDAIGESPKPPGLHPNNYFILARKAKKG